MEPSTVPSSGSGGAWYKPSSWFTPGNSPAPPSPSPPSVALPPSAPSLPPGTVTLDGPNGSQHHIVVTVAGEQRSLSSELWSAALGVGGVVLAMYIVHRFVFGNGDKSDFAYERFDKTDGDGESEANAAPLSVGEQMHAFEQFWAGPLPDALLEVLHWWHSPELLDSFQGEMPKGLLLVGPPGTGKTHFARTLARISSSAFFEANAAQFDEVYVGVGAQRVRRLFEQAESATFPNRSRFSYFSSNEGQRTRAIIFIDELDAIGTRQVYDNQANPSHQTVAQLLTCLDGLRSDSNIFVVAATNNVHALDPALTRSGRFDRIVQFKLPNKDARYRLLLHYVRLKRVECEEDELKVYAELTKGWNAADLKLFIDETVAIAKTKLFKVMQTSRDYKFDVTEAVLVLDPAMLRSAFERVQQKLNIHNNQSSEGADPREFLAKILRERMQGMGRQSNVEVQEMDDDLDGPDD